jgi:hypothetical protein
MLVDIDDTVSSVQYSHKLTKEKLILRTSPNLFTFLDDVDLEMFFERVSVRNL